MMGFSDGMLLGFKVTLLTLIVVVSFIFSSLGWTPIEASQTIKIIVAATILLTMYILMIFEFVNRTLAALIGAAVSIAAHDCLIKFVRMSDILEWEDTETLALLFGMMIIVNILSCSGLFEFLAILAYKKSAGRFWLLVTVMSFITALTSAFIDNVSTMLLMSPTLIKLSELEHIDPRYMLMIMVVFSNIGGCATPVGDPPNLIIISDSVVSKLGITFGSFTAYCGPAVFLTIVSILIYLKLVFKSKDSFRLVSQIIGKYNDLESGSCSHISGMLDRMQPDADSMEQLTKELQLLQKFQNDIYDATSVSNISPPFKSELQKQVQLLENNLLVLKNDKPKEFNVERVSRRNSRLTANEISQLMQDYSIKSRSILGLSLTVLIVAVILFFVQSLPNTNLTLGWISLFAGLVLLVLTSSMKLTQGRRGSHNQENDDEESDEEAEEGFEWVINNIEWSTLIFFFALFIVMEVMTKLGLISFMGNQITNLVNLIPDGRMRSIGAVTIILWASGLASALIDNVPFTSMMIKILGTMIEQQSKLATNSGHSMLAMKPLVLALAFGACFGGNGTIIGASANLVTTGLARRYGYPITFNCFMKFTAPITIITLIVANIYIVVVLLILGL